MQSTNIKLLFVLTAWLTLFCVASPDTRREIWAQDSSSKMSSPAEARKRWDALSAEDQTRLRKRFERLEQLDSSEQEALRVRSARLKSRENGIMKRLSPENRERLTKELPDKRREILAEMVDGERRDRGARIEAKLPKKAREWLRGAPSKERHKRLDLFKETTRERLSALAVEDLAEALGYGEGETKRLERLSLSERMKTVMNLRRKLDKKQRLEDGLPANFTTEKWQELEELEPDEYFAEILRLKHEDGWRHLSPLNREERAEHREGLARERDLTRSLRHSLRSKPSEVLDLSTLSRVDRRSAINSRRREGVIATMKEFEVLDAAGFEALEALPDDEFFSRARALANGWSKQEGRGKSQDE
ncbi:MAG: hypothetical protein ACI8X5_001225 [Planctomycetota bacterium]|jgi:hypothetical protein